jgi:hypothetical protein
VGSGRRNETVISGEDMLSREMLSGAVRKIVASIHDGAPDFAAIDALQALIAFPHLRGLVFGDVSVDYMVDRILLYRHVIPGQMPREELVELIARARDLKVPVAQSDSARDLLEQALPHPNLIRLLGNQTLSSDQFLEAAENRPAPLITAVPSKRP